MERLQKELARSNIRAAIEMGLEETFSPGFPDAASPNPMGLDLSVARHDELCFCAGINPHDLSDASSYQNKIRVNAIAAGQVQTEMLDRLLRRVTA